MRPLKGYWHRTKWCIHAGLPNYVSQTRQAWGMAQPKVLVNFVEGGGGRGTPGGDDQRFWTPLEGVTKKMSLFHVEKQSHYA